MQVNRSGRILNKCAGLLALLFILSAGHYAQTEQKIVQYEKTETMIVMRDGVRLHTLIFTPAGAREPLPILLRRTPYGIDGATSAAINASLKELVKDGYIFAFQDIRGRYKSEGKFVMMRPPRDKKDPKAIDESTDTYDSIEWMIKNVPGNNGRVGISGVSYDGWLSVMALLDPHPALKAASPQASPSDMFLGDDFHHNGAFRLSYGFEYAAMMETSNVNTQFQFDMYDTYDWYLRLGALSNVNEKHLHGKIPTWNDFVAHPSYDWFWKKQAVAPYLTDVLVPTLNVAGWWDQEDFYGPLKIYEALERHDSKKINFLAVGPWNHGGWAHGEGSRLGRIEFDSATSQYFREKIQAPFFAYYLKDKGALVQPEATVFEAGANQWRTYAEWPPQKSLVARNLYFHAGGKLSFDAPEGDTDKEFDSYISDPAHPVPYRPRPVEATYDPRGSGWYTWLVEDQRFAHNRADVLSWETDTLQEDLVIAGDIMAHLFASTSGTDSDFIVKLIDVYPENYAKNPRMGGYQLMVANEVFRGRFLKSFEKPEALAPGQINQYAIDLHTNAYRFLKGHRVMVQVQSSWFPIIDRNPQRFVENIFTAKDPDYQAATQRIFRSRRHPSHVTIPVIR